jgi:hypothetical protein
MLHFYLFFPKLVPAWRSDLGTGKIQRKLPVSKGQNELIGELKMAASDVTSIRV